MSAKKAYVVDFGKRNDELEWVFGARRKTDDRPILRCVLVEAATDWDRALCPDTVRRVTACDAYHLRSLSVGDRYAGELPPDGVYLVKVLGSGGFAFVPYSASDKYPAWRMVVSDGVASAPSFAVDMAVWGAAASSVVLRTGKRFRAEQFEGFPGTGWALREVPAKAKEVFVLERNGDIACLMSLGDDASLKKRGADE